MRGVAGALRASVRDDLEAVGFIPTASKLYRPSPGLVSRSALVEHVRSRAGDVIVVAAPAGYGKSTFVAELVAADRRPTAWVSLTAAESDPAALLSYVALALDEIEPVDPRRVTALWGSTLTIGSPALQHFVAMLADRREPFVLVLDDVHELAGTHARDTITMLIAELPPGSSVVVLSRSAIRVPLGRLRVRRRVVEIGAAELAFDEQDASTLFEQLDVDLSGDEIGRLVGRTEGWPVAVYLAALAHGTRKAAMPSVVDDFAGDDRHLAEYVGEELLSRVGGDVATFLMEASCFERMCGDLCDEVLGRRGSAQLLENLQRENLLVISLDDRREWYRFHHLMAEFLQSELARRDRLRLQSIHLRASGWYDARFDGDAAVTHAVHSGDLDRAEEMVVRWNGVVGTAGRLYPSTARWIAMFPEDELNARPDLMVVAALASFGRGQPGPAVQWLARAAASLPERYPDEARGRRGAVALALARSIVAPLTPVEMAADAAFAYARLGLGDGHPMSCLALGAAAFLLGDDAEAQRMLREGAATTLDRPLIVANCLAHLAIIDVEHGRWNEAATSARRARELIGEAAAMPSMAMVIGVIALIEAHAGRDDEADCYRQLARQHLTGLLDIAPWLNLQARVALSRAAVLRGNRVEATALIDEAAAILESIPDAGRVAEQIAAIRQETTGRDRSQSFGPSSLTTAELRVLQLLPTHLSVAEIADRLYVSRNTVKSQTIAIYRKLGTSSRGGAVEIAAAVGLLVDGARQP
jgi:LuxR family maltose regulon positive regulatory protein